MPTETRARRPRAPEELTLRRVAAVASPALVVVALLGAPVRSIVFVGGAAALVAALQFSERRGLRSATTLTAGVIALAGGVIAAAPAAAVAGAIWLVVGVRDGWGINRQRSRRRAWLMRGAAALGALVVLLLVVYPSLLTVDYLAKPRRHIDDAAFAIPHQEVRFRASDGVQLAGWFARGNNGAAVVVVHGGGGDRTGAVRHATMLARAGYSVLLYDARGRGQSDGHENAAGYLWARDVHGAVDFLARRGFKHINALGLSTGAEAVVAEAAHDPRVHGVVADGVQGRTPADASHLAASDRVVGQPVLAVVAAQIRAVAGERQPPPLADLVHRAAHGRTLLLIATVPFERKLDPAYARGTSARVWMLPGTPHTGGLQRYPQAYRRHVLAAFDGTRR